MNRRGFLSVLGKGAVATTAVVTVPLATVEEVQSASLADIRPGSRHFAVFMDLFGRARRTMMIDDLPQEVHITIPGNEVPSIFRLVSVNRYDGRTIEGLARYIQLKGPIPESWGFVSLGF